MIGTEITKRSILSIFAYLAIICFIIFLTYQRVIKQDDGWYASYAFRWMQKIGNTHIKSLWDYTDSNGYDIGCSFVITLIQGIFFTVFGISVLSMKALNAFEAIVLCSMLYIYLRKENRVLGLVTTLCLICWSNFHMHFFNRPELPASAIAILILYLLTYCSYSNTRMFFAYFLTCILLDMHPLSLFIVIAMCIKTFWQKPDKRWFAIAGWVCGMTVYFIGNYLINHSFGIFTGAFTGTKFTGAIMGVNVSLSDHYVPIQDTGLSDIIAIAKERFSFITKAVGVSGYIKLFSFIAMLATAIYLWLTGKLVKNAMLVNSLITYIVFIILATFLSEAISNGFRLYNAITFGIFYFSLLYAIYNSIRVKKLALIGLLPFFVFAKDAELKVKESFRYHEENHYYQTFVNFNNSIPDNTKVLMRPTHAIFNYRKHCRFEYTHGLLCYMNREKLSFKDAIIKKHYNYLALDEQFETEFFIDVPSPYRQSPSPYYYPLRNTGLTSAEFKQLVATGFLTPVASLYDAFAGKTVLYKVNYL
jgi:hypothetical protein